MPFFKVEEQARTPHEFHSVYTTHAYYIQAKDMDEAIYTHSHTGYRTPGYEAYKPIITEITEGEYNSFLNGNTHRDIDDIPF